MTIQPHYKWIVRCVLILATGIVLFGGYYTRQKRQEEINAKRRDYVYVELRPLQTALGWGYEVLQDGKSYIQQEFIPAIPGRHGFPTKESALMVGRKVVEKIKKNDLPTISIDELRTMGILNDSLAGH